MPASRVCACSFLLALLMAARLCGTEAAAGSRENSGELLRKAQSANEGLYSALQSFVCREQIQRYKGSLNSETGKPVDTVTASLSFENGVEHYSEILQNNQLRTRISSLPGAWSEGEFGTLLRQTETLLRSQAVSFQAFTDLSGTPAAVYRFSVSEQESPWDLEVGGRHYHLPFRTDVWISIGTGEIMKIARSSLSVPAETRISEVDWKVTLGPVALNDKTWLLPRSGEYAVFYVESNRREWNLLSFSDYRRYGAEAAVRYEDLK
jgi:hypothetical protein